MADIVTNPAMNGDYKIIMSTLNTFVVSY